MTQEDNGPKLHIDSDWKAQAQAEKARLADQERQAKEKQAQGGGGQGELPEPTFSALITLFAQQAVMGLGVMQDPDGKGVMVDLDGAHFNIELLEVLEEKTKGNLTDEEASQLKQMLHELRTRFVQIADLLKQQMAGGGQQPGAPGGQGGGGPAGVIDPTKMGGGPNLST
jgi:hypothetical protein